MLVVIDNSLSSQAMNTSVSEKRKATLWRPTCRRPPPVCFGSLEQTGELGEQADVGCWRGNKRKQLFRMLEMHNHYTSLSGHIVFWTPEANDDKNRNACSTFCVGILGVLKINIMNFCHKNI